MKIAVIGAGASGLMAAYVAATNHAKVVLFESNDKIGKKILSTGNGKCNFSNMDLSIQNYYADQLDFVEDVLSRFGAKESINMFRELGMLVKDKNGYLYPNSEQAQTVVELFENALNQQKVELHLDETITVIESAGKKGYKLFGKREYYFDKVILACGGMAAPKTGSNGNGYRLLESMNHSVVKPIPALVQLYVKEPYIKKISGVRSDCGLSLLIDNKSIASERGELQVTDYGISGIVTFQLSRIAGYALLEHRNVQMSIDYFPDTTKEELKDLLEIRAKKFNMQTYETFVTGLLNKKIMLLILELLGKKPNDSINGNDTKWIYKLVSYLKEFKVTIEKTNSFDHAQVTAGGIPLKEISNHFESKVHKNLYITGEILNVDGKCGGYNLQWAWASGYLAAMHASLE